MFHPVFITREIMNLRATRERLREVFKEFPQHLGVLGGLEVGAV